MGLRTYEFLKDLQELTQVTEGKRIVGERVRMVDMDIVIEGSFELPQLARLSADDQIFITAFVCSHGSIKEMERIFGVSYPIIKSRPTGIRQRSRIRRNQARSFKVRDPRAPAGRRYHRGRCHSRNEALQ